MSFEDPASAVAIVGRLLPGTYDQAAVLIDAGPPFDPSTLGVTSHTVFASEHEVVWVFYGQGIEGRLRTMLNDPVVAAAFGSWGPLLSETPYLARLRYRWPEGTPGA
jgi:hypothetical protein